MYILLGMWSPPPIQKCKCIICSVRSDQSKVLLFLSVPLEDVPGTSEERVWDLQHGRHNVESILVRFLLLLFSKLLSAYTSESRSVRIVI